GEAVDLTVPRVNVVWQGDANSYAFRALALAESPPAILNVTGAGSLAVRDAAQRFARRFGREARFAGEEGPVALVSDASRCRARRERSGARLVAVAGVCGPTPQAVAEAELARSLGYDLGLLSLGALARATNDELIAHCRRVAEVIPVFGFYLQPAVGGRVLDY